MVQQVFLLLADQTKELINRFPYERTLWFAEKKHQQSKIIFPIVIVRKKIKIGK
jgi:hypothetical protein